MSESDIKPIKLKPKERPFYVSNKELYACYVEWYKQLVDAKEKNEPEPEMPKFIAESIMKICTRLSWRPNFINYSYKEEMIGDAIENCIRTVKNFNPAKYDNPFSFITTIAWRAFLRRIEFEKKQTYIKGKMITNLPLDELIDIQDHDEETMQTHNQFLEYLRDNSYVVDQTNNAKKAKKKILHEEQDDEHTLEQFFEQTVEE